MPAKLSTHFREFTANAIISSIDSGNITEWKPNTNYQLGQKVYYSSYVYVCAKTGTSATTPPTHISGQYDDGTTSWIFLEILKTGKIFQGNMYIGIGKKDEWNDPLNPDQPISVDLTETDVINNLITLKRINDSNMRICVNRYNWTSGTIYSQYDDSTEMDAYTNPFYVITDDLRLYKCLDNNNNSPSVSKPSNIGTLPFRNSSDGYVWKFMGSVLSSDAELFMTNDFFPVNVVKSASDNPEQWAVQNAALQNSISTFKIAATNKNATFKNIPYVVIIGDGQNAQAHAVKTNNVLTQVFVTNPGSGYTKQNTYAIIMDGNQVGSGASVDLNIDSITGAITGFNNLVGGSGYSNGAVAVIVGTAMDGKTIEPAYIDVVVSNGVVVNLTITDAGKNYASAKCYIVPGPAGAIALPIMAPTNGHGYNIVKELGASNVILSVKFTNDVEDSQYLLIGDDSEFHQVSLITDIIDKHTNEYASANMMLGPIHPDFTKTNNENPNDISYRTKMKPGTGTVLYIDNIRKVVRATDQEENIKIAITL